MIDRLCGPALCALIAACSGHAGPSSESPAPPAEGGAHFDGSAPDAIAPSDGRPPSDSGTRSDGTVPSDGDLPSDSESPYTVISKADCGLQPTAGSKGTDAMAPLDGRCDLIPRLIVSPLSYATSTDGGAVAALAGALVASASDLYYTVDVTRGRGAGSVMRVALGGGLPTLVASGYLFVRPALENTSVLYIARNAYPTDGGDAIVSIPLSGGPATTVVSLPNNDSLGNGLATDGANVYFDDFMGLQEAPLTSDSGPPPIVSITGATTTGSVFVTYGIGVFGQNLLFSLPQGDIESVPLPAQAGSPVTMLAKTGPAPLDLARCGSNACWFDQAHNSLELMSPLGGPISRIVLTGSLATERSFAHDGTDFYVMGADQTTQTLARVPADGSCPADLVHMPLGSGIWVAVDGECVYWSTAQGIFNLAKVAEGPFVQ